MSENWREEMAGNAGDAPRRVYVDTLHVDIALSEIRLDLSQAAGDAPGIGSVFPFVTQPENLVSMGLEIDSAVARYRSRFGEIVTRKERGDG